MMAPIFLILAGKAQDRAVTIISAEEELKRVINPIEAIHKKFPEAFISIDTYYSKVAKEAVAAGACIVNDISAGSMDEKMYPRRCIT